LTGMKWSSPSPAEKKISLVRPLLDLSKEELRQFALKNKIQFRDDATNFSSDFLRNRIRNKLLPLLRKDYQSGLSKTVLRVMEIVGAESDFIGAAAATLQKNGFENLPLAIQRRVLQSQLKQIGVAADFDLVEQLRASADKFVSVGSGLTASRDASGKLKLREHQSAKFNTGELDVNLSGRAGDVNFGGTRFKWQIDLRQKSQSQLTFAVTKSKREFFDAGKIGSKVILRHWRAGDRFQPIGLKSAAKLQDLFMNAKIQRERRRKLIVAEAASGKIFWVEGLRISENFKITPKTKRQLIWRWQNQS